VLTELRGVLVKVEAATRTRLHTDTGVWVEKYDAGAPPEAGGIGNAIPGPNQVGSTAAENEAMRRRYGTEAPRRAEAPAQPQPDASAPAGGFAKSTTSSNEVDTINLTFRAVSLTQVTGQADANKEIFYSVLNELKSSPFFVAEETHDTSPISADEPPGTFTFGVSAKLKKPLKLF
jgi:hypothetical protein